MTVTFAHRSTTLPKGTKLKAKALTMTCKRIYYSASTTLLGRPPSYCSSTRTLNILIVEKRNDPAVGPVAAAQLFYEAKWLLPYVKWSDTMHVSVQEPAVIPL
jgi:hypothetical protein